MPMTCQGSQVPSVDQLGQPNHHSWATVARSHPSDPQLAVALSQLNGQGAGNDGSRDILRMRSHSYCWVDLFWIKPLLFFEKRLYQAYQVNWLTIILGIFSLLFIIPYYHPLLFIDVGCQLNRGDVRSVDHQPRCKIDVTDFSLVAAVDGGHPFPLLGHYSC